MSLFRRSTIFHVEESIPDPEELKLRFRRRILLCATAAFLGVLGAPVARDLRPNLRARSEARRFAERLLEARTLASGARVPVALDLAPDRQTWTETLFVPGDACATESYGPPYRFAVEGDTWKIQGQLENGAAVTGHRLCWHPRLGLLLDSRPLGNGNLLVSLSSPPEDGAPEQEMASVLVTQSGAELQTISY